MNFNKFCLLDKENPDSFWAVFRNMIPSHEYCQGSGDIWRNSPRPTQLVCKFVWHCSSLDYQFSQVKVINLIFCIQMIRTKTAVATVHVSAVRV